MERPSLRRVLCGAALVLLTALTLLSILSHRPTDKPFPSVLNAKSEEIQNECGVVGAYISGALFHYIGKPASYLLVGLGVLWVGLFFSRRRLEQPVMRLVGVLFLIIVLSGLVSLHFEEGDSSDRHPGIVGKAVSEVLTRLFRYWGSLILLVTVGIVSLFLATDMLLYNGSAWLMKHVPTWVGTGARMIFGTSTVTAEDEGTSKRRSGRTRTRRRKPQDSEDEEEPDEPVEKRAAVELPQRTEEEPRFISPETLDHDSEIADIAEPTPVDEAEEYVLPDVALLDLPVETDPSRHDHIIQEKARVLERCLREFGINVQVVGIDTGPVVTLYELELAPGIKVGRIIGLSDDIAMAVKAPNVRIVAPIPGKSTVGVEVPNLDKELVRLVEIMTDSPGIENRMAIPLYLGKDAAGAPLTCDLTTMPHLLIAGETGSGKSVCINSIILSILMTRSPHQVRFLLVDPKMVELSGFKDIPHLLSPVVTDMKSASRILEWAEGKMDERYEFLAMADVRNIAAYNRLGEEGLRERLGLEPDEEVDPRRVPFHMPYIVIIVDELADLMMLAPKEIETSITRLAQKSRAVGIHIILSTQRPSVNVITGLIKSNLPARISFRVPSKVDSRTILDQNGADKLLGKGDMLFLQPGTSKILRAQGTYVSDEEIGKVVEFARSQLRPDFSRELVRMSEGGGTEPVGGSNDPLYDEAVRVVLETQRGSVSLLQRKLTIGYSRAARLIDFMAEDGIVGSYKGSQAREVLYTFDEWTERLAKQGES